MQEKVHTIQFTYLGGFESPVKAITPDQLRTFEKAMANDLTTFRWNDPRGTGESYGVSLSQVVGYQIKTLPIEVNTLGLRVKALQAMIELAVTLLENNGGVSEYAAARKLRETWHAITMGDLWDLEGSKVEVSGAPVNDAEEEMMQEINDALNDDKC